LVAAGFSLRLCTIAFLSLRNLKVAATSPLYLSLINLKNYFNKKVASDWMELRNKAIALLQREDELAETVRLVGLDVLSSEDRIAMETARSIREDFLQQFAFDKIDTYSPIKKQYLMLKLIMKYYNECLEALKKGVPLNNLISLPVREDIAKAKYIPSEEIEKRMEEITHKLKEEIKNLFEGGNIPPQH